MLLIAFAPGRFATSMNAILPFSRGQSEPPSTPCSAVAAVPSWVWALPDLESVGVDSDPWRALDGGPRREDQIAIRIVNERQHGLISVCVPGARRLSHDQFSEATEQAYGIVLDTLPTLQASFPIRMWNVIPGILEPLGGLDHRYMVFNQSRYRAFSLRSDNAFESSLPTATGVGNLRDNDDLTIHCLSAAAAGRPLENPRQVPAYRYSERFGPRPPCFSRATALELLQPNASTACKLLIGGTASVRGEDSHHRDDLAAQLDETELNLRALAALVTDARSDWHGHFEHLRIYHRRPEDRERVKRFVERTFPTKGEVELFSVDICREELMVEIEGVFAPL